MKLIRRILLVIAVFAPGAAVTSVLEEEQEEVFAVENAFVVPKGLSGNEPSFEQVKKAIVKGRSPKNGLFLCGKFFPGVYHDPYGREKMMS